jgi:CBS-domain-containing membrane protein
MKRRLTQLPTKLKARLYDDRQPPCPKHACWSFISAIAGILAIYGMTELVGCGLLIGSFGASAVLLFGVNDSPLAQPRNLIGGHVISASVAVLVVALCGTTSFSIALAVALAISLMHLTHTTHPPGGATALIGVQGHAGPLFVLVPVLAGAAILLIVALFTNNIVYHRQYPRHWL